MPREFYVVQMCKMMHCDYWTLMMQPKRHLELFNMYLEVEAVVKEEAYKRSKMTSSPRSRRYGR